MAGTWGGARKGAGRKPKSESAAAPKVVPAEPRRDDAAKINQRVAMMLPEIEELSRRYARHPDKEKNLTASPFRLPQFPKGAIPPTGNRLAMDEAIGGNIDFANSEWSAGAYAAEGLAFLGYTYLSELAQRPEYRVISETIADDATRKWIDFDLAGEDKRTMLERAMRDPAGEAERQADPDERKKRILRAGKADKVKRLKDDQLRLNVQQCFYECARNDGFFGRSHLFIDLGTDDPAELKMPIGSGRDDLSKMKIGKDSLKGLRVIEPVWTYPQAYNAVNPLKPDWYNPQQWYVMGQEIHVSRLPVFIGHPVPDMLKPAYAFGGLSLSQMAKPYVDIWLTTRQSVSDLIHSFSVMVLMTDLSTLLQSGSAGDLMARVALFNMMRDNQGAFVVNKATEDFKNVSASLSGLHELQAQAQEHMASVSRIPLVKLTGISPSGLNASSEGEILVYDDTIMAYQNRFFRTNLQKVIDIQQLSLFGEIDPEITWHFEPLRQMTQAEKGQKEKDDADRNQKYVDMGALAPEEIRQVIIDDETLPYTGLDPDDMPEPPDPLEMGGEESDAFPVPAPRSPTPRDRKPGSGGFPGSGGAGGFAGDAEFKEHEHPRGPDGKFTSGSGGGGKVSEVGLKKRSSLPTRAEIKSEYRNKKYDPKLSMIDKKIPLAGTRKKVGLQAVSLGSTNLFQDKNNDYYRIDYSGKGSAHPVDSEYVENALEQISGEVANLRLQGLRQEMKFEQPARDLGNALAARGYDVTLKHPDDSNSRYLFVRDDSGNEIKIRMADHPQPVENGQVVGGYNKETYQRHPPADISIDPETGITAEKVLDLLPGNGAPPAEGGGSGERKTATAAALYQAPTRSADEIVASFPGGREGG